MRAALLAGYMDDSDDDSDNDSNEDAEKVSRAQAKAEKVARELEQYRQKFFSCKFTIYGSIILDLLFLISVTQGGSTSKGNCINYYCSVIH